MNNNSSAVAREALRQLASKKLPPTPDNYTRIYHEIASPGAGSPAAPAAMLREFVDLLHRRHPESANDAAMLERAIENGDLENGKSSLLKIIGLEPLHGREGALWGQLINELLRQMEVRTPGVTRARKREALEHVLTAFSGNSELLYARLRGLVRSWQDAPKDAPASTAIEVAPDVEPEPERPPVSARLASLTPSPDLHDQEKLASFVRELLANTLTFGIVERLGYSFELAREARELADQTRAAKTTESVGQLGARLKHFWVSLEIHGDDQREILQCLLRLLNALCGNVGELIGDDAWLRGQLQLIETLTSGPIDRASLAELERGLREVMFKQGTLKHSLDQAKDALKNMVTTFIDRLTAMADNAGGFHDRMSGYAERIEKADNISDLSQVVAHVMQDTRNVQANMQRSRDDLLTTRKQVDECQVRIVALQQELVSVSDRLHEDQLTNLLNRRGLTRAFEIEAARADRRQESMCLSILDIDNFKHLNDTLGHKAGDLALVHLAGVVRQSIRPSDIISRYGGEEFVILLPETPLDVAVQVMTRVQRELTRRFFLNNNERVLITFSAGVAQRRLNETQDDLLVRADRALYEAKHSGKNRVVAE
jgi:diguanylate cyclase